MWGPRPLVCPLPCLATPFGRLSAVGPAPGPLCCAGRSPVPYIRARACPPRRRLVLFYRPACHSLPSALFRPPVLQRQPPGCRGKAPLAPPTTFHALARTRSCLHRPPINGTAHVCTFLRPGIACPRAGVAPALAPLAWPYPMQCSQMHQSTPIPAECVEPLKAPSPRQPGATVKTMQGSQQCQRRPLATGHPLAPLPPRPLWPRRACMQQRQGPSPACQLKKQVCTPRAARGPLRAGAALAGPPSSLPPHSLEQTWTLRRHPPLPLPNACPCILPLARQPEPAIPVL
jgi:hypothetical protein